MGNINLFDFIMDVFTFVSKIATQLWILLTNPISEVLASWNTPAWLNVIISAPIQFIFGPDGTLLQSIPILIGLILLVRIAVSLAAHAI